MRIIVFVALVILIMGCAKTGENMAGFKEKSNLSMELQKNETNTNTIVNMVLKNIGKNEVKVLTSYIRIGSGDIPSVNIECDGQSVTGNDQRGVMGQPSPNHYLIREDEVEVINPGESITTEILSIDKKTNIASALYRTWNLKQCSSKEIIVNVEYNVPTGFIKEKNFNESLRISQANTSFSNDIFNNIWEGKLNARIKILI